MCATPDLATLFGTQNVVIVGDETETEGALTFNEGPTPALLATHDQAQRRAWARAFGQWLAELPSANTRRAYERAWRDLLDFTGKPPWAIRCDDVAHGYDREPFQEAQPTQVTGAQVPH